MILLIIVAKAARSPAAFHQNRPAEGGAVESNQELFETMHEEGVVAVLRSESVEQALDVARACVAGGVRFIEVTFSVPDAAGAIRALSEDAKTGAIVGAGTVLTVEQAGEAIAAGARFIVAPVYSPEMLALCQEKDVPYIPGCMTVNEMFAAQQAGCPVVKFFPASQFTPGFIKAVHAPLPTLDIMPTGGINLDNAAEWIAKGAFALGVGGNLTTVGDDGLAGITKRAAAYREQVRAGRQ